MERAAAALIVLLMGTMPARAWSPDGHRAVCMVAWEQVNATAKAQVLALLDSSADTEFYEACVWADTILKARPATAPLAWHEASESRTRIRYGAGLRGTRELRGGTSGETHRDAEEQRA